MIIIIVIVIITMLPVSCLSAIHLPPSHCAADLPLFQAMGCYAQKKITNFTAQNLAFLGRLLPGSRISTLNFKEYFFSLLK